MKTQKQNSKQYIKSLTIIFFALLVGQIAFSIISLYLNLGQDSAPDESLRDIFIYVVPFFVLNGFITGQLIYKSKIKKIIINNSLKSKMEEYKGAIIIKWAMLEGASLFSIVVYFLTADLIFIGMAGLCILYFIILKPTIDKIKFDLELNSEEIKKLEDENEIIAEFQINY